MAVTPTLDITLLEESQSGKVVTMNAAISTLEKALGYHEVTATTGTVVLTDAQAEYGLIRATGALTGNLLIQIPADYDAGWRIVSNETTNAFTVDVEFVGGSASEEITQGEAAIFIDGVLIQMGGGGAGDGGLLEVEIVKEAIDGVQPTSNFATWDTRNTVWVADFDASTDESLIFQFQMPDTWDGGNIEIDVYAYATSATTGNVVWQAAWERGNTDIDADSFTTAQGSGQVAVNGTSGIPFKGTITFTSSQIDGTLAGEPARIKLNRDADSTSATDDATGDAELIKIVVKVPVA